MDRDRIAAALPNYEIRSEIGRGAWGVVLSAEHRQLGRGVAVKQLPEAFARDPLIQRRFAAEARLLASLDHPHIVPIFDYVEDDGLCLLVMELLTGGTVRDRFATMGIGVQDACSIVLATCAALHYAHARGILHRDIKPENLLFNAAGTLKVTDFGIAKVLGGAETVVTQTGALLGTPAYMAPEQVTGATLGPATDVYAVATMLYELLSGQLPFSDDGGLIAALYRHVYEQPTPLGQVAPAIPAAIAQVVMQGLATEAGERQSSAEDFGVAVAEAATDSWGPGWLDNTELDVMVSRRVAQRISNPTMPPAEWLGKGGPVKPEPSVPPDSSRTTQPLIAPLDAGPDIHSVSPHGLDIGPSVPPPQPRRKHRARTAALVAAAVVAGAIVAFLATRPSKPKPAAAPATSTTTAPRPKVVFRDDFTDSASGWAADANQPGKGMADYRADGYYLTVLMPLQPLNTFSAASPYVTKLTSMAVTVHATFVTAGATDGAGVRCDQGSRMGLRYTFQVADNGTWMIFKIDDTGSATIKAGTEAVSPVAGGYDISGQCTEVAGGTQLTMTINGNTVAAVTDPHSGTIGWNAALTAYRAATSPATVVRFNNFQTLAPLD